MSLTQAWRDAIAHLGAPLALQLLLLQLLLLQLLVLLPVLLLLLVPVRWWH